MYLCWQTVMQQSFPALAILSAVMANNKNRTSMRNVSFFLLLVVFFATSCNAKRQHNPESTTQKIDNAVSSEKMAEFLSLFKTIDPKGLHVYPPTWNKNGKLNSTPFEGVIIDVDKYPYTDNKDIFINIQACKSGISHIYAVAKFDIDTKYIGLIIRQYSQYDESLLQLLLWDKNQKKIVKGIELADSFGDEGWYFDTESWIIEYKVDSILKVVTWRKDSEFDDDFKNKTFNDSLKIIIFKSGRFIETLGDLSDTINFQLKEWE